MIEKKEVVPSALVKSWMEEYQIREVEILMEYLRGANLISRSKIKSSLHKRALRCKITELLLELELGTYELDFDSMTKSVKKIQQLLIHNGNDLEEKQKDSVMKVVSRAKIRAFIESKEDGSDAFRVIGRVKDELVEIFR